MSPESVCRIIIFALWQVPVQKLDWKYTFDYKSETSCFELQDDQRKPSNGHNHQPSQRLTSWAYWYNIPRGAEGWNCVDRHDVFYSQLNKKITEQARVASTESQHAVFIDFPLTFYFLNLGVFE